MANATHLEPPARKVVPRPGRPYRRVLQEYLAFAEQCAREAADAIRPDFGMRRVSCYKGPYDVQLGADLVAQKQIVGRLRQRFSSHRIVAEEGLDRDWRKAKYTWVIDPLDGTNNFGYGVAHCAVSLALFAGERVVLSVVSDLMTERSFSATIFDPLEVRSMCEPVPLHRAQVSLVTDYSPAGRLLGRRIETALSSNCKRVLSLWAPALDLALIATGALDAMVCRNASILDVCAGAFLVKSAGGTILSTKREELEVTRAMHDKPISFVASRDPRLASELLDVLDAVEPG